MSPNLFDQWRQGVVDQVERRLDQCLPHSGHVPTVLHEAMHYAVKSPGKRIRSLIAVSYTHLTLPTNREV